MKKIYLIIVASAIVLTGCSSLHSTYVPQMIEVSDVVRYDIPVDTTSLISYQQFYRDPVLRGLIAEGLNHNSDLRVAQLNISQARATLLGAKGLLQPTVSLNGNAPVASWDKGKGQQTYSIGPEISWEIDAFGKMTNDKKATAAGVEEQEAYEQAVRSQLIAAIARDYYTLSMLDRQVAITQQALHAWDEQIQAQKALMEVGEGDASNITQAEASQYAAETTLEQLKKQILNTENSLSSLLGRKAAAIQRNAFSLSDVEPLIMKGIPVASLANRPDVRQAEAVLKAAFYRTKVARAAFYPSLRLTGSGGWTNNGLAGIVNPGSILLQAAASLAQPLLAQNQNRANLEIAKAEQEKALIMFQQKVLYAGNEVNNALAEHQSAQKILVLQQKQIECLESTLGSITKQMEYGEVNYLQVLMARQSLLDAQLNETSSKYDIINSYITIFQALGGL